MSTRSEIGIYEKKTSKLEKPHALFYKHSDGYPEEGLPLCMEIMSHLDRVGRTDDIQYAAAQSLYYMMLRDNDSKIGDGCGFGIQSKFGQQDDAEWYYAIYPDRLECYRWGDWDAPQAVYSIAKNKGKFVGAGCGAITPKVADRILSGEEEKEPKISLMFTQVSCDFDEEVAEIQEYLLKGK